MIELLVGETRWDTGWSGHHKLWLSKFFSKTIRRSWGYPIKAGLFAEARGVEVFERRTYRSRLSTAGAPTRVLLASKEREMIRMMADGVSLGGIARRVELREIEVRACLASIFGKLAISGRLELLSPKAL